MPDLQKLFIIAIILLAIFLIIAIILRLIRIAIVIGALIILVPILCTIMWGNGTTFVSKFASLFTQDIEQSITDGYEQYREQNAKDPIVDIDQIDQYFNDAGQAIKDQFDKPVFP